MILKDDIRELKKETKLDKENAEGYLYHVDNINDVVISYLDVKPGFVLEISTNLYDAHTISVNKVEVYN